MLVRKAVLKGFDSGNYTATVRIDGSYTSYLEGVPVARNLSAAEMAVGLRVAVVFFDDHNPKEAVIIGIWAQ